MGIESYVAMLRSSLDRKIDILDRIVRENEIQLQILVDRESLPEELEETIQKKTALIEEMEKLDSGFDEVFTRIRDELDSNREQYKSDISAMQSQIRQIVDRGAQIEAQELRNKEVAQDKFTYIKNQVKKTGKSRKAVNTYYSNMMKVNYVDPQFMDNKK